jgi:hypothetical protein
MTETHTVELTEEQIACIRESLHYSARAIREHDYSPLDNEKAGKLRREKEDLIASARAALARR